MSESEPGVFRSERDEACENERFRSEKRGGLREEEGMTGKGSSKPTDSGRSPTASRKTFERKKVNMFKERGNRRSIRARCLIKQGGRRSSQ